MPPDRLLDDVYLSLSAFFKGYRLIVEEGARAYDFPTSLGTEFNRKVRTLAGDYQILQAYPKLLGPGNRLWFHFVSYKFGRLMLPYALLGMAVAALFPPGWLGRAALMGQAAFYGMVYGPVRGRGPVQETDFAVPHRGDAPAQAVEGDQRGQDELSKPGTKNIKLSIRI